jgi:hypothetical protein
MSKKHKQKPIQVKLYVEFHGGPEDGGRFGPVRTYQDCPEIYHGKNGSLYHYRLRCGDIRYEHIGYDGHVRHI